VDENGFSDSTADASSDISRHLRAYARLSFFQECHPCASDVEPRGSLVNSAHLDFFSGARLVAAPRWRDCVLTKPTPSPSTPPLPPPPLAPQTVFNVSMSCQGCANAVKRILGKMEGVEAIDADVPAQKVTVTGSAAPDAMLEALKKWADAAGKSVALAA
jgi:copper chaperone CopZ